MRRAGQQHDYLVASVILAAEPLTGSRPVRIRKHDCAHENVGLLGIIR